LHGRTFQFPTIPALLTLSGSSLGGVNPRHALEYNLCIEKNLVLALAFMRLPS
tara:strand:+ start:213 stop:371 length:159 start_codon:yes stop_codon:yes gene_type:complete